MIQIHPRSHITDMAALEFEKYLLELEEKHDLTIGQLFACLSCRLDTLARGLHHEEDVADALADTLSTKPKSRLGGILHEFANELCAIRAKHGLTYGELFSILGAHIALLAKYLIRVERHPDDPTKRGDEA